MCEMSDESPANPYAIPESCAAGNKPSLNGVLLECAECRRKTIRPLSAFLRHPQVAIPCPKCGTRYRLEFPGKSQFRYHAAMLPAIGLGVIAIWFALTGQTYRTMDRVTARVIRYFEWSLSRSLISFIEATLLIVLLLTPLLVLAFWGFRVQLRMIATDGRLMRKKDQTAANGARQPESKGSSGEETNFSQNAGSNHG